MRRISLLTLGLIACATPTLADCRDDLIDTFLRQSQHGPYQVESLSVRGGMEERVTMDIVPGTGVSVVGVERGQPIALIVVDNRGWIDSGTGWEELDPQATKVFASMLVEVPLENSALANVACTPTGFTFEVSVVDKMIPGSVETDRDTGRIMKLTTSVSGDPTTLVYTYDASITVAPPADSGA